MFEIIPIVTEAVKSELLILINPFVSASPPPSQAEASPGTQASNTSGLNKREKNRLKGLRRKQRRRERWLLSQLEPQKVRKLRSSAIIAPICLIVKLQAVNFISLS